MFKYIVTAILWTYQALPQCETTMTNGMKMTCMVAHGMYSSDTIAIQFLDRGRMQEWIKANDNNSDRSLCEILPFCNSFKIDSVRIKKAE